MKYPTGSLVFDGDNLWFSGLGGVYVDLAPCKTDENFLSFVILRNSISRLPLL